MARQLRDYLGNVLCKSFLYCRYMGAHVRDITELSSYEDCICTPRLRR